MNININKVEIFLEKKVQIIPYEPVNLKLGYTAEITDAETIEEVNTAAEQLISEVKGIVNKEIEKIIEEEMERVKATQETVNVGTVENLVTKVNGTNYVPQPPQVKQAPSKKYNTWVLSGSKNGGDLIVSDDPNFKMVCPKCGRPLRKRDGKYGEFYGCTGYNEGCKWLINVSDVEIFLKKKKYETKNNRGYDIEDIDNIPDTDIEEVQYPDYLDGDVPF